MRVLLLTLTLLFAAIASAGELRLVMGDEIPLGPEELGPWPGYGPRPSIASDGDRTLIVYIGGSTLQAVMLDRNGTLLTESPLLLHDSFDAVAGDPLVLWCGGHYVVLYNGPDWRLHAIRLTPDGEIAARVDLSALGWILAFDAATDGEEIVIVTTGAKLFRLTSTLEPKEPAIPAVEELRGTRDVAFGGGRVALVTAAAGAVVIQFVEGGALTAPVRIAEAHRGDSLRPSVDVKWTGTRFVVAWTECAEKTCLGWWAPLGESGAPASLPVPIAYLDYGSRNATAHAVAVVPLDEETIFVRWETGSADPAYGRRYTIDGRALDAEPLELGRAGVEAFRTAHDLLLTADMSVRMTVTRAPATAPLANPLPRVAMARTTASEIVLGAAASASEIAILRLEYREPFQLGKSIVTITSRDGQVLRHVDVDDGTTAIASDGHEFYLLSVEWGEESSTVWLRNLAGTWRVRISRERWGHGAQLVWAGSGLVALWSETSGGYYDQRLQRFSRDGVALGPVRPVDPSMRDLRIGVDGDKLLLVWYDDDYVTWTMRTEPDGTPLEAPRMLAQYASARAPVSNGKLIAIGFQEGTDAAVELRSDNVPYARATLPTYDVVDQAYGDSPYVAIAGELVFAVYRVSDWYGRRMAMRAALLRANGTVETVQQLFSMPFSDPGTHVLLPIADDAVLLVYQRYSIERPHLGQTRAYARVLTVGRSPGRRRSAR